MKLHSDLLSSCLTVGGLLLLQTCRASRPDASHGTPARALAPRVPPPPLTTGTSSGPAPPRTVTWVVDIMDAQPQYARFAPALNRELYPSHSWLEFSGTPNDPPFILEIIENVDRYNNKRPMDNLVIRGSDLSADATGRAISWNAGSGAVRRKFKLGGQTQLTNKQILDPRTGNGLAKDVWFLDARSRWEIPGIEFASKFYDCNSFVRNVVRNVALFGPDVQLDPALVQLMHLGETWTRLGSGNRAVPIRALFYERLSLKPDEKVHRTVFDLPIIAAGTPSIPVFAFDGTVDKPVSYIDEWARLPFDPWENVDIPPLANLLGEHVSPPNSPANPQFAGEPTESPFRPRLIGGNDDAGYGVQITDEEYQYLMSSSKDKALSVSSVEAAANNVCPRGLPRRRRDLCGNAGRNVTVEPETFLMARVGGKLFKVALVSLKASKGIGVVATVLDPVFVTVDVIGKKYVSAAFGAAGLIAGLAIPPPKDDKDEEFTGGTAAALFDILPSPDNKKKDRGGATNAAQIVQWTMFGNRDHTGNEKCRDRGNKDCTVLYGPGVLATMFKWSHYDSVAFQIEFNEGYAMSIPDIAGAFHVIDPKVKDDGASAKATINCRNKKADSRTCDDPIFEIKRGLMVHRWHNQTAEELFRRIIPQADGGGDCKLVVPSAHGIHREGYNFTVIGSPAAITCGVSQAAASPQIAAMPIELMDPINSTSFSNSALAGGAWSGAGFVAAPPARPFKTLSTGDNVVCLGSTADHQSNCFPNGVYGKMDFTSMGWDARHADSLDLPAGGNFTWGKHSVILSSQTTGNDWFRKDIKQFNTKKDNMVVRTPNPDGADVVCLFDDVDFKGNVACFGEGGGDLADNAKRKARSVWPHGKTEVWLYTQSYGDNGGVQVNTPVPDLNALLYGTDSTLSQNVVALWVNVEREQLGTAAAAA